MQAAKRADLADFTALVGDYWDEVKENIKISVRLWKRLDTVEDQALHLSNKRDPPMHMGRAWELAREINKLLGIGTWVRYSFWPRHRRLFPLRLVRFIPWLCPLLPVCVVGRQAW